MIFLGDGVGVASVGDVLMVRWRKPATQERFEWLEGQVAAHRVRGGNSLLLIYVILSSSSPPDSALRTRIQAAFSALGPDLRRLIVVPVGNPVWQSLVRTIVRGVMMVTQLSRQVTLCSTEEECLAAALLLASPRTPGRVELDAQLAELRGLQDAEPTAQAG